MPVDALVRGRAQGGIDRATIQQLAACVRAALATLGRRTSSTTVVLTDDQEIRALNRRYRRIDRATDVLSFQLQALAGETDPRGNGVHLGDIVVSVDTARRRAPGRRLAGELRRLAIHGLCHLFGHDHKRAAEARVMRALERRLRRAVGNGRDRVTRT